MTASDATREKLRGMLRDGKLDDREVEVEITDDSNPLMSVLGGQPGIDESALSGLKDMLGSFGRKTKRQKLKVPVAWRALTEQEVEKLIDHEAATREAVRRAENAGIVFLDEIDKIATKADRGVDVSREGVQRDLLPIVEGSTVTTKFGPVKTDHVLFIAAGAFHTAKPSDLIPELQGRFPIRVELTPLTAADFVRILTEPTNALTRQYAALLATDGVTIEWTRRGDHRARADRGRGQPAHPRYRRAQAAHRARAPARRPALQRARHRHPDDPDHAGVREGAPRRARRRRGSRALHPVAQEWYTLRVQTQADLLSLADHVLVKNYRQQPIVLERGRGCEVWDVAGTRYLDMTAGIAVCGLGHAHPKFTARVAEQLGKLVHVSNLYFNDQQILAAKAIVDRSFARRVFFCNSGAEANEGALKLARRYQAVVRRAHHERTTFVSTQGSFHGRSFATLSITGQPKYREGFGPLVGPVELVPYDDLEAAARVLETRTACAMIVEPIQAEGGIVVAAPGYLAGLRRLCDDTGTLLIFDEVQTGVGRTGTWFGHQHDGVVPDVMTLAKGLGGGVPIGAVACSEKAAAGLAFVPGQRGPARVDVRRQPARVRRGERGVRPHRERGPDRARRAGRRVSRRAARRARRGVPRPRGRGPGPRPPARGRGRGRSPAQVTAACREKGLLLSVAGDKVVRFAPPYVVSREQLDEAVTILRGVLATGAGSGGKAAR